MCIIKSCHCIDRDTNPTASTASSLYSSELPFMLIVQIVNALFDGKIGCYSGHKNSILLQGQRFVIMKIQSTPAPSTVYWSSHGPFNDQKAFLKA